MPTLVITILNGPAKGKQHRFDRFPAVIGRSPDCALAVPDERVSRAHARIRQAPEGLIVEDLQSRNGTFVNNARLAAPLLLTTPKATLRLGQTDFQLEIEGMAIERDGLPRDMKGPRQLVEAVMVLDLCDSTIMANRYGDAFALQMKEAIRALARPILVEEGVAFLKGTGDGFLATFPSPCKAVEAAVRILQKKGEALPKTADEMSPQFRVGIHFGPTNVDSDGDRQGDVVNMAFRLEGVGISGFHETSGGIGKDTLPLQDRIFISEHAHDEVQRHGACASRLVGFFDLKGIAGRHRVFEILWREIDLTKAPRAAAGGTADTSHGTPAR